MPVVMLRAALSVTSCRAPALAVIRTIQAAGGGRAARVG